jgi:glucose/arabinose dehydrogenase
MPSPARAIAARAIVVPALAVWLVAGACQPQATASPIAPTPAATATPSATPTSSGASAGSEPPPSLAPSPSPISSAVGDPSAVTSRLETVATGLEAPVLVTGSGDGSGRLFALEQGGRIRIVQDGALRPEPFLDLSDHVLSGGERGLLGLAFHPGYDGSTEPRFYVDYTDRDGNTVIAEYRTADGTPNRADPGSARVLLRVKQPFANHNGGGLAFGPDGDLYIGMGDGGSGGDPQGNGQRLDTRLGKLLRIDVDARTGGLPYAIPADAPYAGRPDAAAEIWAFGLRNPWRFSFDRATGDLWIGDVGQGSWEEIDRATRASGGGRGTNFGWNRMEGRHCYPSGDPCDIPGLALPVAEYAHDVGCAVTGGYVYRGAASPALAGVYVFGDYCSGRIWGLSSGGPDRQDPVLLLDPGARVSSFGEDDAGELYLTDLAAGSIQRLIGEAR